MAQIKTFKDLQVWQKAHELTLLIYTVTRKFPDDERFGLISQQKRAAVSIASNIVEGFRRHTVKDSLNFYNIAASSLEEVKYQLLLSKDLKFINKEDFEIVNGIAEEVSRLLYRWIESNKAKLTDF